jgi:serine/threonine protein kinase
LEPSGNVCLKGITIERRVPVLIHKTHASPTAEIGIIHLCNHLKAVGKCLHPNIIMPPTLFSSKTFNEISLVYPRCPSYCLTRILHREHFTLQGAYVACYAQQMMSGVKLIKTHKLIHGNINGDAWLFTLRNQLWLFNFGFAQEEERLHLALLKKDIFMVVLQLKFSREIERHSRPTSSRSIALLSE